MSTNTNTTTPKLDITFVNPFVEGTIETLRVQCSSEAKQMKPFLRGNGPKLDCEIAAFVGITSSAFSGSMALCFTKSAFLGLMNSMMGENYTEITNDIQDGAAELCNIIFGQAKRVLNNQGHDVQLAIPSIMRGQNLEPIHLTRTSVIIIPFETINGPFQIEICGENRSKKAA
jgi:chemotaxis protein CheX